MAWVSALMLLLGATLACAEPTAIDVTVYSEVPCSAQAEVALSVADDPPSLAGAAPASVATRCADVGDGTVRRGDVVIVPQGDKEKTIAFQLTTRNDAQPLDSCAADPNGCIVARRQLRFQSTKTVEVRVDLRLSCLSVACPPDQTCVRGTCVPAQLEPCDPCGEPGASIPGSPTAVTATPISGVVVTTLAGSGKPGFADGTGALASFAGPKQVAVDSLGAIYVADFANNRIRKVTSTGVVTTLAGSGASAFADGTGAGASFFNPKGVGLDASGNVYVGDMGNHRIRKVTSAGAVTTLAGSGTAAFADGTGPSAQFSFPSAVAVGTSGEVYVADTNNNRIRKVTSASVVTTLAGSGTPAFADGTGAAARFSNPWGVAVDSAGNVYVADEVNNRIRKVTGAGVVTTLAGSGAAAFGDGAGPAASFNAPFAVAVDGVGNVYVADTSNHRIRKVTSSGVVTTLAGSGVTGRIDGAASVATFNGPTGIAIDGAGSLYVADGGNDLIRKLTSGTGELAVSWVAPTTGLPIGFYTASASAAARPTQTCTTVSTMCTIGGLTSGVAYGVTVTATNSLGTGLPSTTIVATPN